jgi:hypothetical protein
LVRAPFEVSDNGVSSRVMVLAESLRRAEEVLRSKYPDGEVRRVFPLDGEHIFAGHGEGEKIEGQDLLQPQRPKYSNLVGSSRIAF